MIIETLYVICDPWSTGFISFIVTFYLMYVVAAKSTDLVPETK